MAFNRSHLYSTKERQLSLYANALGYPARPRIILQLTEEESYTVEELKKSHPLSASTISQHLKILREAALVNFEEEFPFTHYSLNHKNLARLKKEFQLFIERI